MVREIQESELKDLLNLYLHLHEDAVPKMTEHLEKTWQRIMNDENYHIVVKETEGKLVSSCTCVIISNLTRGIRPYAFIENVVTHASFRKKGYASECLSYARDIAETAGCYKMMLLTGSKENAILKFYQEAGYNSQDKTAFVQWL